MDGVITEGETTIDESMITGEPIPVNKSEDDKVSSGTINGNQSFLMKAEKVGSDTLLSQIIHMVNDASRSRAPIQNLADKVSGYFVPVVVIISINHLYRLGNLGTRTSLCVCVCKCDCSINYCVSLCFRFSNTNVCDGWCW